MASGSIVEDVAEGYTVGRLAELAGVTVRTLHHYDAIGLVPASLRSAANYRLYTDADVERLRQVLLLFLSSRQVCCCGPPCS